MRRTQLPAVLALLSLGACALPRIEATPEYGLAKLHGDLGAANGSISAHADFDDLGLDDHEGYPGARVDLQWGAPHLTVDFARWSFSGDGTATAQLEHDGTVIPVGASVASDVDLTRGAAVVTFDVLPTDAFELGLGVGLEALDFEGKVRDTGTNQSFETREQVPIPVLAARAAAGFGPLGVDALVTGSGWAIGDDEVRYYAVDLRARWEFNAHVHALLGWRRWHTDLEYSSGGDRVDADMTIDGPYLGVVLAF
jgi:hypothetical protein